MHKLNFGAGKGGTVPLSGALFNMMAGVNIVHVPYSNQTQAVTDLLANQMQVSFDVTPTTIEYVRTGRSQRTARQFAPFPVKCRRTTEWHELRCV